MEYPHVKSRLVRRLLPLFLLFLECHPHNLPERRDVVQVDRSSPSPSPTVHGRKGRQFMMPMIVLPHYYHYQLGHFMFPQSFQSHPFQYHHYQPQSHFQQVHQPQEQQQQQQKQSPVSIRNEEDHIDMKVDPSLPPAPASYHQNRDAPPVVSVHSLHSTSYRRHEEENMAVAVPLPDHASPVPTSKSNPLPRAKAVKTCKTQNNQVGSCKKFAECFPMVEIEYGNENRSLDMDSPLVEHLAWSTNTSICSQGEGGREDENLDQSLREVCCPREDVASADYRVQRFEKNGLGNYYGDREVNLPPITQRPPVRKVVISRELIGSQKCGQSESLRPPKIWGRGDGIATPKITGGQEAVGPKEFPWMVAVFGKNGKILCGASLISDRFLLSAAHCFSTFAPSDIQKLWVHLGDYNIRTMFDGKHEVRKIDKIIIHKGFKIKTYVISPRNMNDIALVKLDRPVNFTDRIQPICLPEPTMSSMEKEQVIVTGWGRKFRYGVTSDVLRKVEMPVWNHAECKRVYETFAPGRLLDSNICAGDGKRNKDACLGDSGGPAIMHDGNKWVQLGITSWGKGCGNFPGVYTRVDKYLMWITKNLAQYSTK